MAFTPQTVPAKGYRETMRALNNMEKDTKKAVRDGLKEAAEPIAATARSKLGRFAGASTRTIKPRVTTGGVFVTQGAKKVTGKRGDFGALQMRDVMIPAAAEHEDDVADAVVDAFNLLAVKEGF